MRSIAFSILHERKDLTTKQEKIEVLEREAKHIHKIAGTTYFTMNDGSQAFYVSETQDLWM